MGHPAFIGAGMRNSFGVGSVRMFAYAGGGFGDFSMAKKNKKVIVVGTTHEQQMNAETSSMLERKLRHYVRGYGASIIIEEWKFEDDKTIGKRIADSLSIVWCNAGTPPEQFETYGPHPVWMDDGSCETERPYGPIEVQIRRESYMVDRICFSMTGHETGIFVCGMGHMHSISEKLHRAGYEVDGFSCLEA
jgi:hypothetical protein